MRLINAEKAMEHITAYVADHHLPDQLCVDMSTAIQLQPTAYDLNAVIQQLEDLRDGVTQIDCCPHVEDEDVTCMSCYMDKAIEIVKHGGRL